MSSPAFVHSNISLLPSKLLDRHQGGFELCTWSNLPTGSGLGTSSILAGAVMAALWKAAGFDFSRNALIHAVSDLEQMLTTGGGWQDQVGGLVGGIKIGRSAARLPQKVEVEDLALPETFVDTFSRHLVLIYTGKTRLARNLLQNVVRNWYARMPEIVTNADNLTQNAEACAEVSWRHCLDCITCRHTQLPSCPFPNPLTPLPRPFAKKTLPRWAPAWTGTGSRRS